MYRSRPMLATDSESGPRNGRAFGLSGSPRCGSIATVCRVTAARWQACVAIRAFRPRETGQASTTRRFRQVWQLGGIQPGGAVGGRNIECFAELRIRTDYAGDHAQQQFIIIDDFYQLQDTLSALKSATNTNGIVLVQGENYEPAEDYDTST